MKLARASGRLGLVAFGAFVASAAPSALASDTGWYGGVNAGQSRAKIDDARIIDGLSAGRFATTSITDDDRDTGYKLFGGYQINRNFALEGGFFDLGKFGFTATTIPAGTFSGNIKVRGVNLDLVGILPMTEKFSAFGRIGVSRAEARDSFSGTGLVSVRNTSFSKRDTNYKAGLGLQYDFTESLAMRAEVERYRINDGVGNKGDIDLASIGLVFRFGGRTHSTVQRVSEVAPTAPAQRVTAPEPVTAAPAPRPAVIAPPPPLMKVTFSADALFDFDKATLKPAGKKALDKFAADLKGIKYDVVIVTGHADRIGSVAYNKKLSARRAEAVKDYLVQPSGIPAGKITSRAADESQPVTKPGECKGNKPSKSLIACLQPDRRVEVEVTGTR